MRDERQEILLIMGGDNATAERLTRTEPYFHIAVRNTSFCSYTGRTPVGLQMERAQIYVLAPTDGLRW